MPPRFAYWTIIVGQQATAFRSQTREELLPTLKQLQRRHPDAAMMWFARGRLWHSPQEALDAQHRRRATPREGSTDRRGKGWRPGGQHRDPRERFKVPRDVRRKRFAARQRRDQVSPRPPRPRGRLPRKKRDDE